ncbi:MAG: capsid portal protein, partial [Oxalobacter sp.]|nr:capsid portal protein [Oxalobacter sp.]
MSETQEKAVTGKQDMEVFSFGDPVPMLDRREILDYIECWSNGRWYETPISLDGLAKSLRANVHHESAIFAKRNILASTFIPHPKLSFSTFEKLALDFLVFGNAYPERKTNRLGKTLELKHSLAKFTRRGIEPDTYYFVHGWKQEHEFAKGSVFQLMEADINQEIYGMPAYLSALQSAWLNEAATLFRRKYYQNGSHAGFIMYMTDAANSNEDIGELRKA